MILLKILANLIILIIGLEVIFGALEDKKSKHYPKWLWIIQFITGIIGSLCSFSVWFVH